MGKEEVMNHDIKNENLNFSRLTFYVIQGIIILFCVLFAIFILINDSYKEAKQKEELRVNSVIINEDSMEPTILSGQMIFNNKFKVEDILDIGTVVIYPVKAGSGYQNHCSRIVGYYYFDQSLNQRFIQYGNSNLITFDNLKNIKGEVEFVGYVTRGDKLTLANDASIEDYAIYYSDGKINYNYDERIDLNNKEITGVWNGKSSTFLGKVITFLNRPINTMFLLVLPIVLLILLNGFFIVKGLVNDKKSKAKEKALINLLEEQKANEDKIKLDAVKEYLASQKEDELVGQEKEEKAS